MRPVVPPCAERLLHQREEHLVPEVHVEQEATRSVREDERLIAQQVGLASAQDRAQP
jgi:hypothetical protein